MARKKQEGVIRVPGNSVDGMRGRIVRTSRITGDLTVELLQDKPGPFDGGRGWRAGDQV